MSLKLPWLDRQSLNFIIMFYVVIRIQLQLKNKFKKKVKMSMTSTILKYAINAI